MSATAVERCPWCGSQITHAKFLQVQAKIREDERNKLADTERLVRARLEKEVAAQQQKLLKERQALDAEKAKMLRQAELAKQQAEAQRKKELAEVRKILEKDREAALLKRDAEFAREREALQKKISEMSRRVQKGGDVGEGAELDVYEELRGAFPDDQLARVKGRPGILLHDIRYKGKSAGKIVLDITPRASWQHAFVTKLRQAQTELAADHALLSTPVFPAGKRELFIESGVIVIAPARVRPMVEVLRKSLIAMHAAKLGEAERADKLGRLYRFITSPAFKRKLGEASDLATEALEIDVQEKRAHDTVWKKRGTVLTRIRHILRDLDTDVAAIIEAKDEESPRVLRPAAWRVSTKDEE
ncbi:MAG TPA: DUF2130 domain-containing protein [Thermoanaerobaculia bacterium]|jgi:hypothetical protein|nr:DUF2130 domain-containing protein [Thermoanaerobaculia bacterium]